MAIKVFEVDKKWGPKRLRQILETIQDAINDRTPRAGIGIEIDESPDGSQISTAAGTAGSGTSDDGGGGGMNQDLYGSFNGAPAVFHLSRTRAPTVPPP